MMDISVVQQYIRDVRADHSCAHFDRALDVFDSYKFTDHLLMCDEAMNSFPHSTDDARVAYILGQCKECMVGILTQQGIQLVHDIYLSKATEIAAGVRALQDYAPEDDLLQILNTDLSAKDVMMECLALTCKFKPEELMMLIESVDLSTIDALKAILREKQVAELNHFTPEHISVWKKWREYAQLTEEDWILSMCQFSSSMNLPFTQYFSLYLKQCGHKLLMTTPQEYDAVARDLLCMAYLSCDAFAEPLMTLKGIIKTIHLSPAEATALDVAITTLSVDFNQK